MPLTRPKKVLVANVVTSGNIAIQYKDGSSSSRAAESGTAIKKLTNTTTDGTYWITVNGSAREVYCDMNVAGGGWMLWACKKTYNFVTMNGTNDTDHMKDPTTDKHGHIPLSFRKTWSQLLWIFNDKSTNPYGTIYDRTEDQLEDSVFKMTQWAEGFTGNNGNYDSTGYRTCTNVGNSSTENWSKWDDMLVSPNNRGQHTYSSNGISMQHGATGAGTGGSGHDKLLDLWDAVDATNNYTSNDGANSIGTKCIVGYCRLTEPVLFMFR